MAFFDVFSGTTASLAWNVVVSSILPSVASRSYIEFIRYGVEWAIRLPFFTAVEGLPSVCGGITLSSSA